MKAGITSRGGQPLFAAAELQILGLQSSCQRARSAGDERTWDPHPDRHAARSCASSQAATPAPG